MKAPDPITVEIIRNALLAIARQMSHSLARAAYNPVIYDMKDFSVGIFDTEVQLLGQAPGLPLFLGALDQAVEVIADRHPTPQPGDVFLVNDSYLVGSHLNDVNVIAPIFWQGDRVGWSVAKAHWSDIGNWQGCGRNHQQHRDLSGGAAHRADCCDATGEMERRGVNLLMRNSRTPHTLLAI